MRFVEINNDVRIYPNYSTISKLLAYEVDNRLQLAGVRLSRRRGEGIEFHQLRDYRVDFQRGRDLDHDDCMLCGSRRFIVCSECKGSRRGNQKRFGKFLKCSVCNENGLMPCPSCNAAEHAAKMGNAAKMQDDEMQGDDYVVESVAG